MSSTRQENSSTSTWQSMDQFTRRILRMNDDAQLHQRTLAMEKMPPVVVSANEAPAVGNHDVMPVDVDSIYFMKFLHQKSAPSVWTWMDHCRLGMNSALWMQLFFLSSKFLKHPLIGDASFTVTIHWSQCNFLYIVMSEWYITLPPPSQPCTKKNCCAVVVHSVISFLK